MDKPACVTCNERIQLYPDNSWKHMGRRHEHEAVPQDTRTPEQERSRQAASQLASASREHPWHLSARQFNK